MNFLYCLVLAIMVGFTIALEAEHGEEYNTMYSELLSDWVDPLSTNFEFSRIESPMANYSYADWHDRNIRGADCPCTSVFMPNTYTGGSLPQELIEALSFAQCLWSCIISLPANSVQLQVTKTTNAPGVLASAGPQVAQIGNKLVPCALASCSGVDIQMNVDPVSANYYYGLDGHPGASQYDFVTIALHELGHGFGIIGFATPSGSGYRAPVPTLFDFDTHIRYGNSYPWAQNPPASASNAIAAITSGNIYFSGTTYQNAKLYAPSSYSSGSSMYHLDESAYPAGNADSLMTPMLRNGESIHSVGRLSCDMLKTIGYNIPNWAACDSSSATSQPPAAPLPPTQPSSSPMSPTPSRTPVAVSTRTPARSPVSQTCTCTFNY